MMQMTLPRSQRGMTLIVGMIMLVLITLVVTSAFTLSNTNLKAVGNMQFRQEAVAAANVAIERVMNADFTIAPAESDQPVDIDNNGTDDYIVHVDVPVCVKEVPLNKLPETDPDYKECSSGAGGPTLCYETFWDITATVTAAEAALWTGATATVRQGASKRVNVTKKNCPST